MEQDRRIHWCEKWGEQQFFAVCEHRTCSHFAPQDQHGRTCRFRSSAQKKVEKREEVLNGTG
jgi:hypothetical protein